MSEWRDLKMAAKPDVFDTMGRAVEVRICECGQHIILDLEAAKEWDVYLPADEYYALFPNSPRSAREIPAAAIAAKAGLSLGSLAKRFGVIDGALRWLRRKAP